MAATERHPLSCGGAIEIHTDGLNGTLDFGLSDDEEWSSCRVVLRVPGFEANYSCGVQRPELVHLRGLLAKLSAAGEGEVDWGLMEAGLALNLKLNRLGQIVGRYELRARSDGARLIGPFAADQTHLRLWVDDLDAVLGSPAAG